MTSMTVHRRSEAGFTLIELLVAITLLGIIIVPLTGALMAGFLTTGDVKSRIAETNSTLFTSAFWADDVQSADTITKAGVACDGSPSIVTFTWATDPAAPSSGTSSAAYVVKSGADGDRVVRVFCGASGTTVGTVAPKVGATAPVVSCLPDPTCAEPTQVQTVPATVTITMTTPKGFEFSVSGTQRSTS